MYDNINPFRNYRLTSNDKASPMLSTSLLYTTNWAASFTRYNTTLLNLGRKPIFDLMLCLYSTNQLVLLPKNKWYVMRNKQDPWVYYSDSSKSLFPSEKEIYSRNADHPW